MRRALTGNLWDAEDVAQDALPKACAAILPRGARLAGGK
jgi:DNA-directed RNA polymerase specialized sigma24 family protein